MVTKTICKPTRTTGKPGPKTIIIPAHKRSTPKKLPKCK